MLLRSVRPRPKLRVDHISPRTSYRIVVATVGGKTGRPNPRMPRVMTRALRTATKGRGDGRGESAHRKVAQQPISSGVLTECRPQRGE
jgi:hypothetical protein